MNLPEEIIEEIIKLCDNITQRRISETCKLFNTISMDIRINEDVPLTDDASSTYNEKFCKAMCSSCRKKPVQIIKKLTHDEGCSKFISFNVGKRSLLDKVISIVYNQNNYSGSTLNISYFNSYFRTYAMGVCETCDYNYKNRPRPTFTFTNGAYNFTL